MSACTRPHCVSIFWGLRRRQLPASSQPNLGSTSPANCSQWWPPTLENGNALGSQNHIMFLYLSTCPWQFLPFKIILKKKVLLLYDPSQLSITPNKIRVEYAFKKTFKKKQPCALSRPKPKAAPPSPLPVALAPLLPPVPAVVALPEGAE